MAILHLRLFVYCWLLHTIRDGVLQALVAISLLKRGKCDKALQEVEQAIVCDSLGPVERVALGDVYHERNEFDRAIDAWKDALLRRNALLQMPHDPEIYFKIGNSYVKLAQYSVPQCQDKV